MKSLAEMALPSRVLKLRCMSSNESARAPPSTSSPYSSTSSLLSSTSTVSSSTSPPPRRARKRRSYWTLLRNTMDFISRSRRGWGEEGVREERGEGERREGLVFLGQIYRKPGLP